MPSLRTIQWQSKEEWLEVYSWVHSGDILLKRKACGRINAWESRGKLPAALDATRWLLDAETQDCGPLHSDVHVREAYSVALMRFVSIMTDQEQKGAFARSVMDLADNMGIPRWIVDLRNSIAHRHMPGLEPLRSGARACLRWLSRHYWQDQVERWYLAELKLSESLELYFERAMDAQIVKVQSGNSDRSAVSALQHTIQQCVCGCPLSATVDFLVGDSMLVMSDGFLELLDKEFVIPSLSEFLQRRTLDENYVPRLSAPVVQFWKPLLHWIHEIAPATFCEKLVLNILKQLACCSVQDPSPEIWRRQWLLAGWAVFLLEASCRQKDRSSLLSLPGRLRARNVVDMLLRGGDQATGVGVFCTALVRKLIDNQRLPSDMDKAAITKVAELCSQLAFYKLLLRLQKV